MQLAHSIDEGLSRFQLVTGAGNGSDTACAMSLLNWIWRNGDEWSDEPECAHPLIRSFVIRANDDPATTAADRAELVRLGERGVLDTWWIPTEVVVFHLSRPRDSEPLSALETAKRLLTGIVGWKETREKPNLYGANLADANLTRADLAGANLAGANLYGANLTGAYLAGAYLAGANLARTNLYGANLAGADLTRAKYTQLTIWPAGYDPEKHGAVKW